MAIATPLKAPSRLNFRFWNECTKNKHFYFKSFEPFLIFYKKIVHPSLAPPK